MSLTGSLAALSHALIDLDGRFLSVDDRFCELLRRERREILATTMLAVTSERDRSIHADKLRMLCEQGVPFLIRKNYIRGDLSLQEVDSAMSLLRDGASGMVLAASALPIVVVSREAVSDLVGVARTLLAEQRLRASVDDGLRDRDWALLLGAYVLENEGAFIWADELCIYIGGDRERNLLRLWELVATGALIVDGRAISLDRTSVRLAPTYAERVETHIIEARALLAL